MPRVAKETIDAEAPKRAPRKRVARARAAQPISSSGEATDSKVVRRKSPTRIVAQTHMVTSGRKRMPVYVFMGLAILGFGAAAVIGYSDTGVIDVQAIANERSVSLSASANAAANSNSGIDEPETGEVVIPVQNTSSVPDGGLFGSTGPSTAPTPAPEQIPVEETATTSSSTTDSSSEVETEAEETEVENVDTTETP